MTGQPPFQEPGTFETLLAHRQSPVPSLSAARNDVPPALDAVFHRMMAKRPKERFSTMTELIATIDAVDLRPKKYQMRREWGVVVAVATLGMLALVSLGVVIRLTTPAGNLVIEVDQPGAEISIDGGKIRVIAPDSPGNVEIKVEPGSHTLTVSKGGFEAKTESFTLRDAVGKRLLQVHLESLADKNKEVVKHREMAQWLLGLGCLIQVEWVDADPTTTSHDIRGAGSTPSRPFRLVKVAFVEHNCTDATLAQLAGVKTWREILVNGSPITNDGLRLLSDQPELRFLQLDGTRVTDVGMKYLRRLARLEELYLAADDIDGSGLVELEQIRLRKLVVSPGPTRRIGDACLDAVGRLRDLSELDIASPRITDFGLWHLQSLDLRKFLIHSPAVTGVGLGVIQKWPNLEQLTLIDVPLSDSRLESICKLTRISVLELRNTKVTDRGLAMLKRLPALSSLELVGDHLTNSCHSALLELPRPRARRGELTDRRPNRPRAGQDDAIDLSSRLT